MKKQKRVLQHIQEIKKQQQPSNSLCQPVSPSGTYPRYLNIEEAKNGFVLNGCNGRVVIESLNDLGVAVKEYFK